MAEDRSRASRRRLPPLDPLVAFDAVARHRSFTRAADELCLTQSAISHRVRRLERFFGAPLLDRSGPDTQPTAAGAILLSELGPLLDGMARLAPAQGRGEVHRTLRVAAGSSLAIWWLLRRLPRFQSLHPATAIAFEPVEVEARAAKPHDIRILWTTLAEARAGSLQRPLFRERVFPVCAPSLLPGGRPLAWAEDLRHLPLIQKGHDPAGEWRWETWFDRLRLGRMPPARLVLGEMGLCLTAAADGSGVTLGRSLLVADAIADGRLVPALASPPLVVSAKVHVARWTRDLVGDRAARDFVDWLAAEAAETGGEDRLALAG